MISCKLELEGMNILVIILIVILGLVVGSFLGAFTYRAPKGETVTLGRSFCDHCRKNLSWYDNIPLLSYLVLNGQCRRCRKKIAVRYPLIELATAAVFLLVTYSVLNCPTASNLSALCHWNHLLGSLTLPFWLIIASSMIAIFVIDLENEIILDDLVFFLFILTFILLLLSSSPGFYLQLFASFAAAFFLLLLNLITKGRGMGLGDVKFALLGGLIFGWPSTFLWLFTSFITGAFIGLILILVKKAEFGKHIPFGPFMAVAFFIVLVWGDKLINSLFFIN